MARSDLTNVRDALTAAAPCFLITQSVSIVGGLHTIQRYHPLDYAEILTGCRILNGSFCSVESPRVERWTGCRQPQPLQHCRQARLSSLLSQNLSKLLTIARFQTLSLCANKPKSGPCQYGKFVSQNHDKLAVVIGELRGVRVPAPQHSGSCATVEKLQRARTRQLLISASCSLAFT